MNKEKLEEEIIIMKKSISKLIRERDRNYIGTIERFNQRVVLAVANFQCQRCKSKENLQIHHLIMRPAKDFMDFWRYASQRYYWANQIVLCKSCHKLFHKQLGKDIGEESLIISQEKIKEIKDFFN
ncbi:MAG TPA: HNH endonuclease signature motif containing protein [Candidatus Lokiarchaeia archaeon]